MKILKQSTYCSLITLKDGGTAPEDLLATKAGHYFDLLWFMFISKFFLSYKIINKLVIKCKNKVKEAPLVGTSVRRATIPWNCI